MIKICLDQCAISQIAAPKTRSDGIDELRKILLDGSERNLLMCPLAPETISETTGLPQKARILVHELHSYLAGSRHGSPLLAFKSMWQMINEETFALARSEPAPAAFEWIQWRRIEDDQLAHERATKIESGKQQMCQRVSERESSSSRLNFDVNATKGNFILEHASHVFRQIGRALKDKDLDSDDHMGYELVKYLQQHGVTNLELKKLAKDILDHRWEAIPVIFNRTKLAAQLEADSVHLRNSRKYNANDEIDIPRIAVGLSSADLIVTDSAMVSLCQTVKTNSWTNTKVFSVRDTKKIIEYLEATL